jgi:hypothetical protein
MVRPTGIDLEADRLLVQGSRQRLYEKSRKSARPGVPNAAIGKSPTSRLSPFMPFLTYLSSPQLVMNNFQTPAGQPPKPHLKLITSMFQGLFPPIQVEKVSASASVIAP